MRATLDSILRALNAQASPSSSGASTSPMGELASRAGGLSSSDPEDMQAEEA